MSQLQNGENGMQHMEDMKKYMNISEIMTWLHTYQSSIHIQKRTHCTKRNVQPIAHVAKDTRGTGVLVETPHNFHNGKVSEGILHRQTKGTESLYIQYVHFICYLRKQKKKGGSVV